MAGLEFAYHNHAFEFQAVDGKLPYDIVLTETDASLVKMEMDLFWILKGGSRSPGLFHSLPWVFFPLVHLKGRDKSGDMAPVAADNSVDWKALLAHSGQAGIRHYFVEHDDRQSPFDTLRTSFAYLEGVRF